MQCNIDQHASPNATGRFNLFLDPNTTAIEYVLTFYSRIQSSFYRRILHHQLLLSSSSFIAIFFYRHLLYSSSSFIANQWIIH